MGRRIGVPLRVLLACLAVTLVAAGAAAIGMAGVSAAGGYLIRQADDSLRACPSSLLLNHGLVTQLSSGPIPPGACGIELRSVSGQLLASAVPGGVGPVIPASGSWLAAHLARPVTVPGMGASGRWRVVIEAARYQPQHILYVYGPDDVRYVISRRAGPGASGMLVVMARLAGAGPAAAGYAAIAGAVLVLLAGAAFALARAIRRPLREAARLAETAGQTVAAAPARLMPGPDRTRAHWLFGRTLETLAERLQASRTAEAAARRSVAEVSGRLAEVVLELRRPVSIVHGFAHACRRPGQPPPADADCDRMLRQIAEAAARMETLAEALHALSLRGSTGPDPRPVHTRRSSARPRDRH